MGTNHDARTELQEALIRKIREGTATADDQTALFECVRGFCASVARRYMTALKCPDEVEDLLQESFIAVMDAAQKYDPSSGATFLTWLSFYLHSAFSSYLGRQIGQSRGTVERRSRIVKYEREYTVIHGRAPTDKQILKHFRMRPETLQFLRSAGIVESLDREIAEGIKLADEISSGEDIADTICDRIVMDQVRKLLRKYIDELDPEAREAVVLVFFRGWSMNRCAEFLGITYSCFRTRLERGLRNIGSARHKRELGRYLPEYIESMAYRRPNPNRWISSTEKTAILLYNRDHNNEKSERKNTK